MNYDLSGSNFDANCIIENKNIICKSNDKESLYLDKDIEIKNEINYMMINNKTIYFINIKGLKTFTVTAGYIQKLGCKKEDQDYQFNLIKTKSLIGDYNDAQFEMNVAFDEKGINHTAICTIKNSNSYYMNCIIKGINCVGDIILNGIETNPNLELFSPVPLFFNGFNERRTFLIKAGKLNKGICDKEEYIFKFTNNIITYKKDIKFTIQFIQTNEAKEETAICSISSGEITCSSSTCPKEENDIKIISAPAADSTKDYPNTIWYEGFLTNTKTIKNEGKIIKQEYKDDKLLFLIEGNSINENEAINLVFNLKINENNIVPCKLVKPENIAKFNISCEANSLTLEDEINILEDPINDNYYFYGYKNKMTLTLSAGSIEIINDTNFKIINNSLNGVISNKYSISLEIMDFNDNVINSNCNIEETNKDLICKIEEKFETKLSSGFTIVNNPEVILLEDGHTSLNFINFKDLTSYSLNIGMVTKGSYDKSSNSYNFTFKNTKISKNISEKKYFNLTIKINSIELYSNCTIQANEKEFDMDCYIQKYNIDGIYDIQIDEINIEDYTLLEPNVLYIKNSYQTTYTLIPEYIKKVNCSTQGEYIFQFVSAITNDFPLNNNTGEFKISLSMPKNKEANCIININLEEEKIITCSLELNHDDEYCTNINKDIKIDKIIEPYTLIDDYYLYLEGFEGMETITVEAGELRKGEYKEGEYIFNISNSKVYNNINSEKDIEFPLIIKSYEESNNDINSLNMKCCLPSNLKENDLFNITCIIKGDSGICPLIPPDKDIIITSTPGYMKYDVKTINFAGFLEKSTVITINAGNLYRVFNEQDKTYTLIFKDSLINYALEKDISFNIHFQIVDMVEKTTTCSLQKNSQNIECIIDNIERDILNIKILSDPMDDYTSIEQKTLIFKNFKDKEINTLIAGNIQKGKCEDGSKIYKFHFTNSKLITPLNYEFPLKMKIPDKDAYCRLISDGITTDINCSIEGINSCPLSDDIDIFVSDENPDFYQMENKIIYFSFANKNSISHVLSLENIIKGNKSDCNYYFNFSNQPYTFEYLTDDVFFDFNMIFNKSEVRAYCNLYKDINQGNKNEINKYLISCYFNLEYCDDNNLLNYDLEIGETTDLNIEYSYQNIDIKGLENQKTKTILAQNIKNKSIEDNNFIISIEPNQDLLKLDIGEFNLDFNMNNINQKAKCHLKNNLYEIECKANDKLEEDKDIIIKGNPEYILLNKTITIYFQKFDELRTFTIKAGQIQKIAYKEGQDYQFNLINTISSDSIPEKDFKINVLINETKKGNAICMIRNLNKPYSMICTIEGEKNFVQDIILNDINIEYNPNIEIFSPNTAFFKGFNNKRTITIKSGKLIKGECHMTGKTQYQYNFSFINNEFSYSYNKDITFNLKLIIDETSYDDSICFLNLSDENKIISCNINDIPKCPNDKDDLLITSNPSPNYGALYPNSIFYEGFIDKNTVTISMKDNGKIIKEESNENKLIFTITENTINGDLFVDELNNFEIYLSNGQIAICNIKNIGKQEYLSASEVFDIICSTDLTMNDEIKIIQNPVHERYFFSGYQNKMTLTLEVGSLRRNEKDINSFNIINNKFIGDTKDLKIGDINFNLDVKYSDEVINTNINCVNNSKISDNKIDIICSIDESNKNTKTIYILNNPEPVILLDKNITLNFIKFKDIYLYTLEPGRILKDICNKNNFVFYLVNTTISNPLEVNSYFSLPIKIDETEERISSCQILSKESQFQMYCEITDFCPNNNIDIKIEKQKDVLDIQALNPNSIYIDIPEDIISTTLNAGYIKKISCKNGLYEFTINENKITGKKVGSLSWDYKAKLAQFGNEASCSINTNLVITCNLNIDNTKETEKKYCENLNEDIKIEKLIGNNYTIVDNNIIHYYGFYNLETITVEGGDLKRGYCLNDNQYQFIFADSTIYNNLYNENSKTFSINVYQPSIVAKCNLPTKVKIYDKFDISCLIQRGNICQEILDKDLKMADNPIDILIDENRINFKNFTRKSTIITITGGALILSKVNDKYSLNFSNSNIDYELDEDFSFNIVFYLNSKEQKESCNLVQNSNNITCELKNIESDDIEIKIKDEPNDNYDMIPGKTIIFKNFKDKEIHTLIAGKIQNGTCEGKIFTFSFTDSKSQYNIDSSLKFILQMKKPNRMAICQAEKKNENLLYDIICKMEGTNTCPMEQDDYEITVGNIEPSPTQININSSLYYFSFVGQTTYNNSYYLNGGILTKKSIIKNNQNAIYTFSISDCSINKNIDTEIIFNIIITLEIYDINLIKEKISSNCNKKEISDLNNFDIECTFTLPNSYFSENDAYDIRIDEGDQKLALEDDKLLVISKLNGLSTVTLYSCNILKGECDNNNKYTYKFTSCKIPQELPLENDLEFTLNVKNGKSVCTINKNNLNEIQCEIEDSTICKNNEKDIEIGDNSPIIDYSKYSSFKNFYITGIKNLYTSTLTGGLLNFGKCESGSKDYIFSFTNSKLSKQLSEDINFELDLTDPLSFKSLCTIPKNIININDFILNCIIKGEGVCPLEDIYSLKLKEITEDKYLDIIQPNGLYLNNIKNRIVILIKGGTINLGKCKEKNYEFYFNNSQISEDVDISEIKDISFKLDLLNPHITADCKLEFNTNSNVDIICSIVGIDYCPMFNYTYLKIGQSEPSIDETTLYPKILKFSDFAGKQLIFKNYYISISKYENQNCIDEQYEFDLITTFKSDNIISGESFTLKISNDLTAQCLFPSDTTIDTTSKISCSINKPISGSISFYFDYIYLEEKDIYIINQGEKQLFNIDNVECPFFSFNSSDTPEKSANFSMSFGLRIITSYKKPKEIKILDNDGKVKPENILEFNLNPSNELNFHLGFLKESKYIGKCIVPSKTDSNLEFSCSIDNINDTKSKYFIFEDTKDIIQIDNNKIKLTGLQGKTIENIYKSEDIDPEPGPQPPTPEKKGSSGMSTAAKVILIILGVLILIVLILVLLYYFYFKKKEESEESDEKKNRARGRNNNQKRNSSSENNNNSKEETEIYKKIMNSRNKNQDKIDENEESLKKTETNNNIDNEEKNSFENNTNIKYKLEQKKKKNLDPIEAGYNY